MDTQENLCHIVSMTIHATGAKGLLLLAMLAVGACGTNQPKALALQFVQIGDKDVKNDGGGLAYYGLGTEEEPLSWFADAHLSWSGNVDGRYYRDAPPGSAGDAITDRSARAGALHFGPCYRALDWLNLYCGAGAGYTRDYIERFDPTQTLDPSGFYNVKGDSGFGGSVSFGVLLQPGPGVLMGIGYDLYFEGVTYTLGFAF
jgi:opacity protein-like surface antigen